MRARYFIAQFFSHVQETHKSEWFPLHVFFMHQGAYRLMFNSISSPVRFHLFLRPNHQDKAVLNVVRSKSRLLFFSPSRVVEVSGGLLLHILPALHCFLMLISVFNQGSFTVRPPRLLITYSAIGINTYGVTCLLTVLPLQLKLGCVWHSRRKFFEFDVFF